MSQPSRRCTRAAADIEHSVVVIGEDMRRLSPGELSALRRAAEASVPPAFYWRWKRDLAWPDSQDRAWAHVIAFMANITAKGNDSQKPSPHTQERSFGQTLCDGGNSDWPQGDARYPRPLVSELRLSRFLNTRGDARYQAALRVARMLASHFPSMNCAELARYLLHQESEWPLRHIARDYYARLDCVFAAAPGVAVINTDDDGDRRDE